MEDVDWNEQLRTLGAAIETTQATTQELSNWLWANVVAHDVVPERMPEDARNLLNRIHSSLDEAHSCMNSLWGRLVSEPWAKVFGGFRLSREEYHLFVARDNPLLRNMTWSHKRAGLSEYDDHEVFDMFCYEDDKRRSYINPALRPIDESMIDIRPGDAPEDLPISGLREEQRRFFEKYLPDIAARFSREG